PLTSSCTTLGETFSATASILPLGALPVCRAGRSCSSALIVGPGSTRSAARYPLTPPAPAPTSNDSTATPAINPPRRLRSPDGAWGYPIGGYVGVPAWWAARCISSIDHTRFADVGSSLCCMSPPCAAVLRRG